MNPTPAVYVSIELVAFAERAGVSPYRLACALADPANLVAILEPAELAALKAAVAAPRQPARSVARAMRALGTV